MSRTMLLVALAASAVTANTHLNRCSGIRGVEPFEPEKCVGAWYYLSGNDMALDDTHCTTMHFSLLNRTEDEEGGDRKLRRHTYNLIFTSLDTENKEAVHRIIMQSRDGLGSTGYSIVKREGTAVWSHIYQPSFVAADYDNYMVVVVCWVTFDPSTLTFETHSLGRIFGRKPTLSEDIMRTLTNQMAGFKVDVTKHLVTDRHKCGW